MSKQNTWTAICDDERECWAIVDREPGGSQSHDGDGADEHIADVFDPENAASIVNAAAEITRLRAIVDKLPKTADGVPITPGMEVWWIVDEDPEYWGESIGTPTKRHVVTTCFGLGFPEYKGTHTVQMDDLECGNFDLHSTREAAKKTKEQGNV